MGKTVVICSSASFYRRAVEVADELARRGYAARLPEVAVMMRDSGDFRVESYKTWFANPDDYAKKNGYMMAHYAEIAAGDVVLVVNEEKNGIPGYVGGAALMELAVASYLGKPIYLLNPVSERLPFFEEVRALETTSLDGDLARFSP